MKKHKTNALRMLDTLKIDYETLAYDEQQADDGIAVATLTGMPVEQVYKTLITEAKSGKHYVFVIPVAETLDLKAAAKAVSEKNVAMIAVKQLLPLTGYVRGGCSPVGLKKPFPVVIDETVLLHEHICVSAGVRGLQVRLKPADLIRAVGASTYDLIV